MREEEEEKKDPVSAEPAVDPSSSELCYFCNKQLYVVERGSAEGKFFHRSCFTCQQCGTTLRQGGYTFFPDTGKFYCEEHSESVEEKEEVKQAELPTGVQDIQAGVNESGEDDRKSQEETKEPREQTQSKKSPPPCRSVKRKGSYKISTDPHCDEATESNILEDQEDQSQAKDPDPHQNEAEPSTPVPAPRGSRTTTPSTPVPKPRTIHNVGPSPTHSEESQDIPATTPVPEAVGDDESQTENGLPPGTADSKPKQSLKKLQLSDEEKTQLVNLSFSQDSDSETPASSSAASTSSSSKPHDGGEEEGYWSGGPSQGHVREKKNRRCLRRKEDSQRAVPSIQGRIRSKFSPWNLSSPRLQQRFSVLQPSVAAQQESEDEVDVDDAEDEEDEDNEDAVMNADHSLDGQGGSLKLSDAERQELTRMKTLQRRAKISELQRFQRAQTIQRRLEEIEVTFKDLEDKGVELERSLRGEPGSDESTTMIDDWIDLVQQKNALVSEESDLMVASRQLELEDKQSMLEMELRGYMEIEDSEKTPEQQTKEDRILQEMIDVVDMRNSLVAFLEEKRLKEISEEQSGPSLMETKRHSTASAQVHWA